MNDSSIVTTYVVIDDILKAYGYQDDCRAQGSAAEILTVTVVAAKYLQNHHERTLYISASYPASIGLHLTTECLSFQSAACAIRLAAL